MQKSLVFAAIGFGLVCFCSAGAFADETTVTKTTESCAKGELGPRSVEKCTSTDLKTGTTTVSTKTCDKNEIGGSVKLGPAKAGASIGGGVCTTTTTVKKK